MIFVDSIYLFLTPVLHRDFNNVSAYRRKPQQYNSRPLTELAQPYHKQACRNSEQYSAQDMRWPVPIFYFTVGGIERAEMNVTPSPSVQESSQKCNEPSYPNTKDSNSYADQANSNILCRRHVDTCARW